MALAEATTLHGRAVQAAAGRRPGTTVARRTARAAARSGVLWGYVFGIFVASSAWSYTSIYKTARARAQLAAAFGDNRATIALFGRAPRLDTVGGFTVFKISMTLMIIGSVWALLTSSRLLRGEEDAGRWDLLLSGLTTRRGATAQALAGLGLGAACLWAVTAVITAGSGLSSRVDIAAGPGLFLALALVCPAVMFLAVGAVTSQLAPTRRQAAGYGALVLGVSYCLRMVGDASTSLHWLVWLSPLGWVEQLAPLTGNDPLPLLPVAALTAVLVAVAMHLAGGRDVGASVLPDRSHAPAHLGLLRSALGLSIRLTRGLALSWLTAVAVAGLLFGYVAKGAGETLKGSSIQQTFDKLGATGGGLGAYLGVTFLIVASLIAFAAAGHIGAARTEEAEGRLDHLLVQPLARTRWLAGRLAVALAVVVTCGVAGGLGTWLGVVSQGSGIGAGTLVAAGLNACAPAVFLLGIGLLLFGLWPRVATAGVYAVLAWSLLIELIGGIGALSRWLLDTSVFHHVTTAPAVPVDWAAAGALAGWGVLAGAVGFGGFVRRDLTGA
jgi:ABC-2 type transport system permease protein